MSKPHTLPLKLPLSSERARRSSGVVKKSAGLADDTNEHALFDGDDPTDPHAFNPDEYAKLSLGEGEYRWHDADTDVGHPVEQSGERRKVAARETKRLPLPESHTQTEVQLTAAHHSEIDTEPKIQIEPLHHVSATATSRHDTRVWIATALGFMLGVVVTLTIAWLLQAL